MADGWCTVCDCEHELEVKSMLLAFLDNCPPECIDQETGRQLQLRDFEVPRYTQSYTNHVIRVRMRSNANIGFVIKKAPPVMPHPGDDVCLPVERGETEYRAYDFFNTVVPGCVPTPVFYDKERRILCSRELKGCRPLAEEFLRGQCSVSAIQSMAACLASLHAATHLISLGTQGLDDLRQRFPTRGPMVDMIRLFHFEKPFDPANPSRMCAQEVTTMLDDIITDDKIVMAKKRAKRSFLEDCECLNHGDLHVDSIVVSQGTLAIVDAEFARIGPCAYDMGLLLATLLMACLRQRHLLHEVTSSPAISSHTGPSLLTKDAADELSEIHGKDRSRADTHPGDIIGLCRVLLEEYTLQLSRSLHQGEEFSRQLLTNIVTFAGCELLAWTIGPPHMDFMDGSPEAQVDCVRTAAVLLRNLDNLTTVAELFNMIG